jgi:hypothetical protein
MNGEYPVALSIDYPDHDLNRLTAAFRIFAAIPIAVVLGTIGASPRKRGAGTLVRARSWWAVPAC